MRSIASLPPLEMALLLATRRAAWVKPGWLRAGWTLVDQGVVSGANFFSVLLLARSMSTTQFGQVMLAQSGLLAATALQNSLTTLPHHLLGATLKDRHYAAFTKTLGIVQLLAAFSISLLLLLAAWLLQSLAPNAAVVLLALACIIPPWTAQEFIRRVLYTRSEARRAAANDALAYGLQLLGVLGLVYAAPSWLQPQWVLAVFGASSLLAVAAGWWQLRHELQLTLGVSRAEFYVRWLEVWQLSRWLCAQQIVIWLGANAQGWVLAAMLGIERYGIYRAAYQVVNILNPLRQAAISYLPPRASLVFEREGARGLRQWLRNTSLRVGAPFVLLSLVLAATAPLLLQWLYGDTHGAGGQALDEQYHWVVMLGALAAALGMVRTPFDYAAVVVGGARALLARAAWAMLLVFTLGVALIYFFDLLGALLAEVLVASFMLLATAIICRRHLQRPAAAFMSHQS